MKKYKMQIFLLQFLMFLFLFPFSAYADNIATPSNAEKYVKEVFETIPETVSIDEVNTKEEAEAFAMKYFDSDKLAEYDLTMRISLFESAQDGTIDSINGNPGYFYARFDSLNLSHLVKIIPKPYVSKEYLTEVQDYLNSVAAKGISAAVANTPTQMRRYFALLLRDSKPDGILISVEVQDYGDRSNPHVGDFIAAINGTQKSPNGWNGNAGVIITFKDTNSGESIEWRDFVTILPVPYDENITAIEEYVQKCKDLYAALDNDGISIKDANTPDGVKEYISKRIPEGKPEDIEVEVWVHGYKEENPLIGYFRPAVNGTPDKKNGTRGGAEISIRIYDIINDKKIQIGGYIRINPIPYTGASWSSKDDSSSSVGISSSSSNISVGKNLYDGTWEELNGKWKLKTSNGYANSQWALIKGKWYLFGNDAFMLTGWQEVNKRWYLLSPSGEMLTGWQLANGRWYYMEPSGEMATGWKNLNDKWYYLDSSGAMVANTIMPGGYVINGNGEWVDME